MAPPGLRCRAAPACPPRNAAARGRAEPRAARGTSAGPLPAVLERARAAAEAEGLTAVAAGWDGEPRALFVVADHVKPGAAEAVRRLRELGLRPVLLTGDNDATARAVAAEVGIDEVVAEVLPADKAGVVRRLQRARQPGSSRWSATASTTRPRSRRRTSGWRSAPAPTSRSRRPT